MRLRVENLNHHYGSAQTLHDVRLDLGAGECMAILGTNGVGKTTLLQCIMGLQALTSGRIFFDDDEISRWSTHRRVQYGVGYVPQGRDIFPDLSVGENLEIGLPRADARRRSERLGRVFELFPVLSEMSRRRGGDLSGGQQQQLAIGRALMSAPSLLILDEPTEGIQPSIIQAIAGVITQLKGEMTILLVEQYLDFACSVADHFTVIARGGVVGAGKIEDFNLSQVSSLLAL